MFSSAFKPAESLVCFERREKPFGEGAWVLEAPGQGPSTMPFLHGFRRIVLEYQPLVDELLGLLATPDTERQSSLER